MGRVFLHGEVLATWRMHDLCLNVKNLWEFMLLGFSELLRSRSLTFGKILKEGHEIGFHADRINDESFFKIDLEYVAEGSKFFGFTKHGSRGLRTPRGIGLGEVYNLELCTKRAKDNGMTYFCSNDVVPTDMFQRVEGVELFPGVFWVLPGYMDDSKFTVDWLIDYQRDHDVVVLIHPEDAVGSFPKVAEKVDRIYDCCEEIVSFEKYLRSKKVIRP